MKHISFNDLNNDWYEQGEVGIKIDATFKVHF